MLHSLFLSIFPGCPAHIGASARSTGQCLGIVLILSLIFSFTCQQYVLPFCCLAGADCLLARGNTKLAKFTHSRASRGYFSTLYIVFIHTVEKISMAQPPFGKSTDVRRSTKAVTSWCAILLHIHPFLSASSYHPFPCARYLNNQVSVVEVLGLTNSAEDET